MADILTPAGTALCAALHLTCAGEYPELALARALQADVPIEYRYEHLVGCTDEMFPYRRECGLGEDCVVVSLWSTPLFRIPGKMRLCRRIIPTS